MNSHSTPDTPPVDTTDTPMLEPVILTVELAAQDVRRVLQEQREQRQILTTQLNILFVTNGALLSILAISRLIFIFNLFSLGELVGFFLNFTLLINAFLPRQAATSPNLEDWEVLEQYLVLSPEDYQLQMLVNLAEIYNVNKQRLDDVSQSLSYAAYVTWTIVLLVLIHILSVSFMADLRPLALTLLSCLTL